MDPYLLAGVMINLFMICIGGYMVIRGKALKANLVNQGTAISPNALIIIGVLLISINALKIVGIG
ncbi:hypothetical protein [Shewanella acanthi]|uniref:hypothetical protein n=1 Tax=Shewanella acanthi TaxID=2864212 RepID=UPI001C65ADEF|nr:hypothetical protein [Shewanella acanthi]MCH1929929.1 hypothetical protein [Shewanella shenzhenensis]QYJ77513.1 hypothetical protein K0H61_10140 [Shewanella acanthi]